MSQADLEDVTDLAFALLRLHLDKLGHPEHRIVVMIEIPKTEPDGSGNSRSITAATGDFEDTADVFRTVMACATDLAEAAGVRMMISEAKPPRTNVRGQG